MKLLSYQTSEKLITYTEGHSTDAGDVKTIQECREAPLNETEEALQDLRKLVASVMEVDPSWADEVVVTGFTLSYTKQGTRSMVVSFLKSFEVSESPKKMSTPAFQIDHAATGESHPRVISDKSAALAVRAIEQAERYAQGERQQTRLPLEKPDPQPGEDPEDMLFE